MSDTTERSLLDTFHAVFLHVSLYFAYGYSFYDLVDAVVPIRLGSSTFRISLVALVAPAIFTWFTSRLTDALVGNVLKRGSFFASLAKFFVVVFINACALFGLIALSQGNLGARAVLPEIPTLEVVKYLFLPMLLYAGVFMNWVSVQSLSAKGTGILPCTTPAANTWLVLARAFAAIMFLASFIPLAWATLEYFQKFSSP